MITANHLLKMKDELEGFEKTLTQAEAEKKVFMNQLKDEYDVMTIEEAEAMLEEIEVEYNKLQDEMEKRGKVLYGQVESIRKA